MQKDLIRKQIQIVFNSLSSLVDTIILLQQKKKPATDKIVLQFLQCLPRKIHRHKILF